MKKAWTQRAREWWCRLVEHSWAWSADTRQYTCNRCGVLRQEWKAYYPPVKVTGISNAKYPYVELDRELLANAAVELERNVLYGLSRSADRLDEPCSYGDDGKDEFA